MFNSLAPGVLAAGGPKIMKFASCLRRFCEKYIICFVFASISRKVHDLHCLFVDFAKSALFALCLRRFCEKCTVCVVFASAFRKVQYLCVFPRGFPESVLFVHVCTYTPSRPRRSNARVFACFLPLEGPRGALGRKRACTIMKMAVLSTF